MSVSGAIILILLVALYFLPAIVASRRGHQNATAITVTNVLFGWTFIGWAVALIWASTAPRCAPR